MKKVLIISIIILSLFGAGLVKATLSSDFVNNEAPSAYFYTQEFDKLVMDLTIPSGTNGEDKLLAITLKNNGLAKDYYDIEKVVLWKDADEPGFQGWKKDKELGNFTYYASDIVWYLDGLTEIVPADGLRLFISVEISKNATANRSIQMRIPLLSDTNSNGSFDLGDSGIFMESKNNGPTNETIVNSSSQTIRTFILENLAPKTVITDPKDSATITEDSYTIKGVARDQGGSTPAWVKLGINDIWYDVSSTGSNYATWEYNWTGISEGEYTIKTKSADWIDNTEINGDSISIKVEFPKEETSEVVEEEVIEEEGPEGVDEEAEEEEISEQEKPVSEMTKEELEVKIIEVQQKIIELLNQLIQLVQIQISEF